MKSSPTQKIIAVLVLVFAGAAIVYAAESYRSNPSTTITVNEHTVCKNVINNGSLGRSYFIPTKTSAEWSAFRAADGYLTDISLSDCATCSDGIKNGNETGVDCGGSCAACAPTYTYSWKIGVCNACCDNVPTYRSVDCLRNDNVIVNDSFCALPKPPETCSDPTPCQHLRFEVSCQAPHGTVWQLYITGIHSGYGILGRCIHGGDPVSLPYTNQCWVYGSWTSGRVTNGIATCRVGLGSENGSAYFNGQNFAISGTSLHSGSCDTEVDVSGNCDDGQDPDKCFLPSGEIIIP